MLLLTLIALMGLGGVVLAGFSQEAKQQVDHERYLHNKRVLEEAKQALLMYAYNYPVNNPLPADNPRRGPGRLPCPDTSNNGSPNSSFDCENVTGVVGRFPWNDADMNLYDMRDASGERLWYAVSENFANNRSTLAADVINSATTGTITVHDQGGTIMYDNAVNNGVAAVIIAPGPEIDRNGTPQNRASDINNPIHFLDLFGALDNSDFVNGDDITPSANGFVLGPIFDANGDVIVNDQMILITADELTAVAEKATLEAYRDAIDDYQQAIWGAAAPSYRYPWMNAHADIADLNIYDTNLDPVLGGTTVGRLPFLNYYADLDSHIVITDLVIDYDVDLNLIDTADLNDQTYINAFDAVFTGVQLDISGANLSFKKETFDLSADLPAGNFAKDDLGTLISAADGGTVVNSGGSFSETLYFWDELAANGWEQCPNVIGDERDCARSGGVFVAFTAWPSHDDVQIRKVVMNFDLDADFEIGLDYSTAPTLNPPIAPTDGSIPPATNARFQAVFDPTLVTDLAVDVDASLANDFIEITIPPIVGVTSGCEQDNNVVGEFNIPSSPTPACPACVPDGGSAHCTVTLIPSVTVNQLDITADYYPPLPLWVKHNNWNDSILMAYADDFKPGGDNDCLLPLPITCLTVGDDFAGSSNTHKSLLLGAGTIPALPADLLTIFDDENSTPLDTIFSAHPDLGYDAMLILDES